MYRSRILIVEDDETLLDVLKYNLLKEGYRVVLAIDGLQAVEMARKERPELIILDVMLPKLDGLEVCRILRREMNEPILMLTAKSDEVDKVVGLELGADDYITKPFSMRELLARIRAMLRRVDLMKQSEPAQSSLRVGNFELNVDRHQVFLQGSELALSPKEFDLLALFLRNPGRVFTREFLLEKIWGYEYIGDSRTIDVHVRWLRQRVEADPAHPRHLLTVRGVGYKFEG